MTKTIVDRWDELVGNKIARVLSAINTQICMRTPQISLEEIKEYIEFIHIMRRNNMNIRLNVQSDGGQTH